MIMRLKHIREGVLNMFASLSHVLMRVYPSSVCGGGFFIEIESIRRFPYPQSNREEKRIGKYAISHDTLEPLARL